MFREGHLAALRRGSWRGGRPDADGAGRKPEKMTLMPEWAMYKDALFLFIFKIEV